MYHSIQLEQLVERDMAAPDKMDALYNEFSKWYIALSPTQKLIETTRVASKPYVRQVLIVVPQVETKINRKLKTIFGLTRFIKLFKLL